jgi:hypothetical protein
MSDRSGVGAPTHEGADPDLPGPEASDSSDAGASANGTNGRSSTTATESKPRRRPARDLFGAMLGAEPASSSPPPGVPRTGSEPEAAVVVDEPETPTKAPNGAPQRPRRRLSTRSSAGTSDDVVVDDAPPVIDSSVDSGVVPVVDEEPQRRSRRGGLRARRVHRVIRRVDPWSVLKLSLLFYFCVWAMVVVSGVLIWGLAVSSGTIENVEGFIERLLSFEEFTFNADQIFRLFAMGGLIMVFLGTAITAILAVLFNLISDLVGGIRVTVIEEESTRRIVSTD